MAQREGTFDRAAAEPLAALGGGPADVALDLWADPVGAAEALSEPAAAGTGDAPSSGERGVVLVRAALELAGGAEPGFGPDPVAPWWLRITRGSPEIRACPSLAGEAPACETRRVTRVVVDAAPLLDGGEGAAARVSISLDRGAGPLGTRLLVGEAWAHDEIAAVGRVRAAAGRLARALSVPASLPSAGPKPEADAAQTGAQVPVPAGALARYSIRSEGPRLVLRDFASRGPREKAGLHFSVGLVFAAAAVAAWVMFARSAGAAGPTSSATLAWLGGSVLLTLAAVAFLGVARFARRYAAGSAPLVAFGAGKLVVAPWVSRTGAVGLEMEGRFGAAIELGEVRGVSVQERDGAHAVEIATDHGPMDALVTGDAAMARYLAASLARVVDDLRPRAAPNARQRARARAVMGSA